MHCVPEAYCVLAHVSPQEASVVAVPSMTFLRSALQPLVSKCVWQLVAPSGAKDPEAQSAQVPAAVAEASVRRGVVPLA